MGFITVVSRGEFNCICSEARREQGFTFNVPDTLDQDTEKKGQGKERGLPLYTSDRTICSNNQRLGRVQSLLKSIENHSLT